MDAILGRTPSVTGASTARRRARSSATAIAFGALLGALASTPCAAVSTPTPTTAVWRCAHGDYRGTPCPSHDGTRLTHVADLRSEAQRAHAQAALARQLDWLDTRARLDAPPKARTRRLGPPRQRPPAAPTWIVLNVADGAMLERPPRRLGARAPRVVRVTAPTTRR